MSRALRQKKHAVPPKTDHASNHRVIFVFLGISAAVMALVIYLAPGMRWQWNPLEGQLLSLERTYAKGGLQEYLARKETLRRAVAQSLSTGENDLAKNIAVYLFPKELPEENFEKSVALELWGKLTDAIEENPHSPEARNAFEEIRANIWNYETADKQAPQLSATARQVLALFDRMSAP